ncbi:putative outer membrane autotransporter barrel [hydrothermal vent metagenome]|uniref:Putative outer membrane autotransporter barrel n=1 Tax=hydrothermal vent metagenome TaxID=652676 RepID=A0A1W1CWD2_9ZZZZ
MKKTIAISIITSAILFGATVDNLTTDQVNKTLGSTVSNALVDQGTTAITGSADVDNLTITQKGDNGATGNLINNLTVNGDSVESTHIHQGLTTVVDATVNNVTINSDSSINGGEINGAGKVSQGETAVSGDSTLKDLKIESTNTINNANISGNVERHFVVSQGTLIVTDANTSDTDADNVDIKSTNMIDNDVAISDSTIRQSYTKIASGADITGLDLEQTNTIEGTSSISNDSKVGQGIVMVDEGSTGTISSIATNTLNNVNVEGSTVIQDYKNVHGGSNVAMDTHTAGEHHNTISNTDITPDSKVSQNTYNINGGSTLSLTSNTKHENYINDMDIDNSTVVQDAVDINNSTVTNLTIDSHNELTGVTATGSDINSSKVEQSVLVINNGSNIDGLSLTTNNAIRETDLTDGSNISQSYATFSNVQTTGGSAPVINNSNSVTGTALNNGSTLTQAELTASGTTLTNLTQTTTNSVDGATIDGSTVEQATIGITGGTVASLDIDAINTITTGTNISDSDVSQNHTNIEDSEVNELNIDQNNNISGGTLIASSTVTQGCVRIGSESCFSQGEQGAYVIKTDWALDDGEH